MAEFYLSVVIPCYNEERNIRLGALEQVASYLNRQKYSWQVILVDDGSTDESFKLLFKFVRSNKKFSLIRNKHQGKAVAVMTGILKARGEIILFSDLDQAAPLSEIEKILPYFRKGFQIVIGSRNSIRRGAPWTRIAMAKGFMILRNLILNLEITDTQCGFKAFNNDVAGSVFPRLKVFNLKRRAQGSTVSAGFDIEFLYIAKNLGYRIAEVPVDWHYQETRHINPFKDSLESLQDLIRIRINCLTGIYKI